MTFSIDKKVCTEILQELYKFCSVLKLELKNMSLSWRNKITIFLFYGYEIMI